MAQEIAWKVEKQIEKRKQMLINKHNYYGLDLKEIDHLYKILIPIWEKDKDIDPISLDVAKYLMVLNNDLCPQYIFSKTCLDICSKIKINPNMVALVQNINNHGRENK